MKTTRYLKLTLKKIIVPFIGVFLRILHIKIGGRYIFVNKYTRKIPIYGALMRYVDSKLLKSRTASQRKIEYQKWFKNNYPSKKDLVSQSLSEKKFKNRPLISILIPTYNTEVALLKECIDSVIDQSYTNWEICIADDNSTSLETKQTIESYTKGNPRIKAVFRNSNGHISEATNSALKIASGKYIGLLDHDDVLWPNALYEVVKLVNKNKDAKFIYTDEEKISSDGKEHLNPFFKPDWSFDFLRSINYITHFSVLDRSLVYKVGGFRKGYEGAQDWDLFLRASREVSAVYHIPKILYSWRMTPNSTAQAPSSKDYAYTNQKKALESDIKARDMHAQLSWQIPFSMWRVQYRVKSNPLVSIIIPTKNQFEYIERCLRTMSDKTTYDNYELVIVDTGSTDQEVLKLYKDYKSKIKKLKVVNYTGEFNFSSACNLGAEKAKGEFLLFLNNDTEIVTPSWIEDMLGYAQMKEAGAIGCRLLYPDDRVQHAGIILGVGGQSGTPGIAGHFFPAFREVPPQDPEMLLYAGGTRNFTSVTAACLMVSKEKFNKVDGFDPKFQIAFNDVDFCLKLYASGLRNIYLPHVTLYHHESVSVGQPGSKQRDLKTFDKEIKMMLSTWGKLIDNDPFYHPEFRRDIASARLKK